MSSLGDAPLNRKRKSKNAAQTEAEAMKPTKKAQMIERATSSGAESPVPVHVPIPFGDMTALAVLAELLAALSDVAWLRIIPLHDEKITHWYIKWNRGKWANHYVYFGQGSTDSVRDAITFLAIRFGEVERGERRPHRDNRYSGN